MLGIRLIHSGPYSPQGRGKQEGLNRYIRSKAHRRGRGDGIESFEILNDRFIAWAEQVADPHPCRDERDADHPVHGRWTARAAESAVVADAFGWSAVRPVTKTATISLAGRRFQLDPVLVERRVECRYDSTDPAGWPRRW